MFFLQEYTWDVKLHQAVAYIAMGIASAAYICDLLAGIAVSDGRRRRLQRMLLL